MKRHISRMAFFGFLILALFSMTNSIQAQAQKIRVVVKNASIRISPNMDGEVLNNPNIGSVFDVVKKTDEWFEIKVTSRVGIEVSGYIHEMFVELIGEKPEVGAKREPEPETIKQPAEVMPRIQLESPPKFEILLGFGYSLGYGLEEASRYSGTIPPGYFLESGNYQGTISHSLKNPFGPALAFNYIFFKGLGVQVRFDMNMKSTLSDGSASDFAMNWTWPWDSYSLADVPDMIDPPPWEVTGEASTFSVFSLNLYYKAMGLGMFAPHFSGGISYFSGKAYVNTIIGYGTSWSFIISPDIYEYIDAFKIPASVDVEVGSIGFNFGGGVDISFSRSLAVTLAARYFLMKKIEQNWILGDAPYESTLQDGWTLTLPPERLVEIAESIDAFVFNPSFIRFILGIKIMF